MNRRNKHRRPRPRPSRIILVAVIACLVVAFVIYRGIHSRDRTESRLEHNTEAAATPVVRTVRPTGGGATGEVVLPANVEAYIDTPIYARTSGYLRHWYADIGAHVKKGQLLAIIESPEVDQQVAQAERGCKDRAVQPAARADYSDSLGEAGCEERSLAAGGGPGDE